MARLPLVRNFDSLREYSVLVLVIIAKPEIKDGLAAIHWKHLKLKMAWLP